MRAGRRMRAFGRVDASPARTHPALRAPSPEGEGIRREGLLRPLPAARLGDLDPGEAGGAGGSLRRGQRTIPCNGRARPGWSTSWPAASRGRPSRPASSGASPSKARGCRSGSARNAIPRSAISPRLWRFSCPRGKPARRSRSTFGCASASCRCRRSTRRSGTRGSSDGSRRCRSTSASPSSSSLPASCGSACRGCRW